MTTLQRFRVWLLARRIKRVESRILERQQHRELIDDVIAYHRDQIAELTKRKVMLQ